MATNTRGGSYTYDEEAPPLETSSPTGMLVRFVNLDTRLRHVLLRLYGVLLRTLNNRFLSFHNSSEILKHFRKLRERLFNLLKLVVPSANTAENSGGLA